MKKFYSKIILSMVCFYTNILYTSEYEQKEFARTRLINLIAGSIPILELEQNINAFITRYPIYKSEQTPFCLNRSLFEHLKFHGKENCWPKETSLELRSLSTSQFFTGFQNSSATQSPTSQNSSLFLSLSSYRNLSENNFTRPPVLSLPSTNSNSRYSSQEHSKLSRYGCGKTNLSCAFTCQH